jgi:glucose/arabinose dehydrogenase
VILGLVLPVLPVAAAGSLVPIESGFAQPLQVTNARDGSNRLFVVERAGLIRIVKNGTILPTPFLDITGSVALSDEQGLLGLAFHPKFKSNRKFYVYFTRADGDIAINEFKASSANPNVAIRSSGRRIMTIGHPPDTNHNGGGMAFGKDGFLYIATGDGGGSGDPDGHAQDKGSLLGKILRIDIDRTSSRGNYRVPTFNPYVGRSGLDEVWSIGLRNPWRISFDREFGDLWIGDVGEGQREEVDRKSLDSAATLGRRSNYGWKTVEGNLCFSPPSGCSKSGKVVPIATYDHSNGRCAVTGGHVYRGSKYPKLMGRYIFGDFCSGEIWIVSRSASPGTHPTLLLDSDLLISSFGEDEKGEVYAVDYAGGAIYRVARS